MNNIVAYSNILNASGVKQIPISEGNTVLVRVISNLGNGKYEGSVAGSKTVIYSSKNLNIGSTFLATVSSKNGILTLTDKSEINQTQNNSFKIISFINNSDGNILSQITNPQTAAYLKSLGLVADNLSFHLLQQLKQLGIKFDSELLKRYHEFAKKFPGQEKSAATILLLLKQKGIDASLEDIKSVLDNFEKENEAVVKDTKNEKSDVIEKIEYLKQILKDFWNDCVSQDNKSGLLTILNHSRAKKTTAGDSSWVILPYEIVNNTLENTDENMIIGSGSIKFLISNQNKLKSCCISCNYQNHNSYFVINYDKKDIKSISFYKENTADVDKEIVKLKKIFEKINKNYEINWVNKENIEGLSSSFDKLSNFDGDIS